MIEFKCSYCGAAMSAPAGRLGESEVCPSCGLTTIVPDPEDVVDLRIATPTEATIWSSVRQRWPFGRRGTLIASGVAAVCVIVLVVILGGGNEEPQGLFLPRNKIAERLARNDYFPLTATGTEDTLQGRRLRRFIYVMDADPNKQHLARIVLWCSLHDHSHVVALSFSICQGKDYDNRLDASGAFDGVFKDFIRQLAPWNVVNELSGIRYDSSDLVTLLSISSEHKKCTGHLYRAGGFEMKVIREEYPPIDGRNEKTITMALLFDRSW